MSPKKSKIGKKASKKTRQQFADEIARRTSFTEQELKTLFPKQTDRDELDELLKIVKSATDENKRKARLIKNIDKVAGAVLKVAGKVVAGPLA